MNLTELVIDFYDKISSINEKIGSLEEHVDNNTKSLDEHIRRTEAAEKRLMKVERIYAVTLTVVVLGFILESVYLLNQLGVFG